jgi:hypothetical protein
MALQQLSLCKGKSFDAKNKNNASKTYPVFFRMHAL